MKENTNNNTLKMDGILSNGFGIIPKIISLDTELSIEAKAIYSYLVSFAGGGEIAFPTRSKILKDLNISKDRYYRHFEQLIQKGYITVRRVGAFPGRNEYTIVSDISKISNPPTLKSVTGSDRITLQGFKKYGYGILPRSVMTNSSLCIESKAIYSYFSSFAGVESSVIPKKSNIIYHLNISERRYNKYIDELIRFNFIVIEQVKNEGKFSHNLISLVEFPDQEVGKTILKVRKLITTKNNTSGSPTLQNKDIEESVDNTTFLPTLQNKDIEDKNSNSPTLQNEDIGNEDIGNEDIENEDIENKDITNTNSIIINSIITNPTIINPSIYQTEMEGLIDYDLLVKESLRKKEDVPVDILNSDSAIDFFVGYYADPYDEIKDSMYKEVMIYLKELLKDKKHDRVSLLENLNRIIKEDESLYSFILSAVSKIQTVSKERSIKNLRAYSLKTIYNYANQYILETSLQSYSAI